MAGASLYTTVSPLFIRLHVQYNYSCHHLRCFGRHFGTTCGGTRVAAEAPIIEVGSAQLALPLLALRAPEFESAICDEASEIGTLAVPEQY